MTLKIYSALAICMLLITSCKNQPNQKKAFVDPRPGDQVGFIEMVQNLRDEREKNSGNEYRISEIEERASTFLNKKIQVRNWLGMVEKITGEGNDCYVWVNVYCGPSITKSEEDEKEFLYFGVSYGQIIFYCKTSNNSPCKTFNVGDKVMISGRTEGERSFTNSGALDQPEIDLTCSEITKFNQ
jgi:hypothetical protein